MWLKHLITQYSLRLVAVSRPLSRVSASKKGEISEKARKAFKEKRVLPMVNKLCQSKATGHGADAESAQWAGILPVCHWP